MSDRVAWPRMASGMTESDPETGEDSAKMHAPHERERDEDDDESEANSEENDRVEGYDQKSEREVLGDGEWLFGAPLLAPTTTQAGGVESPQEEPGAPPPPGDDAQRQAMHAAARVAVELLRTPVQLPPDPNNGSVQVQTGEAVESARRAALHLVTQCVLPVLEATMLEPTAQASSSAAEGGSESEATPLPSRQPSPAHVPAGAAAVAFRDALLSARASDGANLLVAAAGAGAAPIVRLLVQDELAAHIDVEARTHDGETALHLAAAAEHREVCLLLLSCSGLPLTGQHARDAHGRTPLDRCPPKSLFRDELEDLRAQARESGATGLATVLQRPLNTRRLLHRRYEVYSEVGLRIQLAQDRCHYSQSLLAQPSRTRPIEPDPMQPRVVLPSCAAGSCSAPSRSRSWRPRRGRRRRRRCSASSAPTRRPSSTRRLRRTTSAAAAAAAAAAPSSMCSSWRRPTRSGRGGRRWRASARSGRGAP